MRAFPQQYILCPLDFSQHSMAALRVASGIAGAFRAEIIVLHVQRFESPLYFTAARTQALTAQLRHSFRAARAHLAKFAEEYRPDGLPRSIQVAELHPVLAILQTCRQSAADLVVMGTGLTRI